MGCNDFDLSGDTRWSIRAFIHTLLALLIQLMSQFLPRDATLESAVMPQLVVRLSVCPHGRPVCDV